MAFVFLNNSRDLPEPHCVYDGGNKKDRQAQWVESILALVVVQVLDMFQ